MSGQMKNYNKYKESLKETPGPVLPSDDKVINISLLFDYLKKTGKKATDLTPEECEPFWVYRKKTM